MVHKFKVGDKVVARTPEVVSDNYKDVVGTLIAVCGPKNGVVEYSNGRTQNTYFKKDGIELIEVSVGKPFDPVSKPSHYNQYGIEAIDAIRASLGPTGFQAYCKGNVIKYLWRYEYKNGLEDLKKAQVYLNWMVESKEDNE
jgi:hypothetical protein